MLIDKKTSIDQLEVFLDLFSSAAASAAMRFQKSAYKPWFESG